MAQSICFEDCFSQDSDAPPVQQVGTNDTTCFNRMSTQVDPNQLTILVASDIHVGYGEKKKEIDQDASRTLEEVLRIAINKRVDMILLGGDLFHESNPTRTCVNKVVSLLRKYCMNDNEVLIEFISDPTINFSQSQFDKANYEDENLNVGLPIFTIHGNHDDMTGKGLTALDPLHEAGLLNLFGKFTETDNYVVSPILLRKGTTRLALYGIGSQRDDRLNRAFQGGTIQFPRPKAETEDWFNLLVLHQNRPRRSNLRSTGAYLPESYIPSFFDLVVWGHEHECHQEPEYVTSSSSIDGDGFFILQPGSTVSTSLTREEAIPKHVFLITISGRKFKSEPIRLETTRQVLVDELLLDKLPRGVKIPVGGLRPANDDTFKDEAIIVAKIQSMLQEAKETRRPFQPSLPLLRLKVTYTEEWAQLMIRRIGVTKQKRKEKELENLKPSRLTSVEDMVSEVYRKEPLENRLTILTDSFMAETLTAKTKINSESCAAEDDDSAQSTKIINARLEDAINKRKATFSSMLNKMSQERLDQIKNYKGTKVDVSIIEREIKSTVESMKMKYYEKEYEEKKSDVKVEKGRSHQENDDEISDSDASVLFESE